MEFVQKEDRQCDDKILVGGTNHRDSDVPHAGRRDFREITRSDARHSNRDPVPPLCG
jgi:hypothetical protein